MALGAALLVHLVGVGPAGAGTQPNARLARMVTLVAGRTVATSCERSGVLWRKEVEAAALASGSVAYYDPNHDHARFGPAICSALAKPRLRLTPAVVGALFIVAHEAAHARGIDDEGVANCWGLYWTQDLARRFLGVRFFSARSHRVLAWARQIQRGSPHEYRAVCPIPEAGTTPWQPPTLAQTTTTPLGRTPPAVPDPLLTIGSNGVSLNVPPLTVGVETANGTPPIVTVPRPGT